MASIAKKYKDVSIPQKKVGLDFISKLTIREGMSVLDLGCGTGHLSGLLAERVGPTGRVLGVDPDAERIKIAQEEYKRVDNLSFQEGSTETFPAKPYDIVFSHAVLHWVSDKETAFKNVYKMLKPGGIFALGVALSHNKYFDQLMDLMDAEAKEEAYNMFHYEPKEYYLDLGRSCGFFLVSMESFPVSFKFDKIDAMIDAMIDWWCAGMHGKFDPKLVETAKLEEVKQPYGDGPVEFTLVEVAMMILKKL